MPDAGIGTLISAGASLIGGAMQGDSANQAADTQAAATSGAVAEQRRQYDTTRADLAPYRNAGTSAVNRLAVLMGLSPRAGGSQPQPTRAQFTTAGGQSGGGTQDQRDQWAADRGLFPDGNGGYVNSQGQKLFGIPEDAFPATSGTASVDEAGYQKALTDWQGSQAGGPDAGYGDLTKKFTLADFWNDPVTQASYQQGLDQGTKALRNTASRAGSINSGAQLKALTRFSTDYTGNQAAGSQARYVGDQTNLYNRLAGISGTGQTAATNTAGFGQSTANTIGGMMTAQGNARGAAQIAGGNAYGGAITNAGNYYGQQQTLDKLIGARSGGGSTWSPSGQWWGTTEANF